MVITLGHTLLFVGTRCPNRRKGVTMRNSDIIESVATDIEETIFKKWKHEGFICGCSSNHVNVEIDGKEYVLVLHEVTEGQCFSQYLKGSNDDTGN